MAVFSTKKPLPTVIVCPDQKVLHPQFSHALTPFRHIHCHSNTVYLCFRAFPAFIAFPGLIQYVSLHTIYQKKKSKLTSTVFTLLVPCILTELSCSFITPTIFYTYKCKLVSLLHVSASRHPQAALRQHLKLTKVLL